jgi:hypothetical protein
LILWFFGEGVSPAVGSCRRIHHACPEGTGGADKSAFVSVVSPAPEHDTQLFSPILDADTGELAAVKLRNTVICDVWLVADAETLAENPDIIRSGLPVFFFDEIEMLRGKTPAELKAIGMVKAEFPTSRVLQ